MYSPFLRNYSSGLSRLIIGLTNGNYIFTFFLAIFMLDDVCAKEDGVAISAFTGSNVTKPYAEIGATFNNIRFGLLLWGGLILLFLTSSVDVLKML